MSTPEAWEAANEAFLRAAFAWLRYALRALTPNEPCIASPEPDWSADGPLTPALLVLRRRFGLSVFETKTLLLACAAELDGEVAALCGPPSFGLCQRLFGEARQALSPHQPLRAWRLVECDIAHAGLIAAPLRPDERMVHFITGLNELDERVAGLLRAPADLPASPLAPSQEAACATLIEFWRDGQGPLAVLTGNDPASKVELAAHAAAAAGLLLCRLPAEQLPCGAEADAFERLWRREQLLLPLVLLIEVDDGLEPKAERWRDPGLRRLILRLGGAVAIAAAEPPPLGRLTRSIEVRKPSHAEQLALWTATLGAGHADTAGALAAQFSLPAAWIRAAAPAPRAILWENCRQALRPRLDRLAQRIEPRADWADLVLPPDREALLRQIVDQIGYRRRVQEEWGFEARSGRGLGIGVLFAGESGTGKTLAAEVLARTLALDLYRIDLAGVVSKYIGETEKNLRALFAAAEESGAILFFDEADALFGRRSEVRDSHDRYANIEVNYLLQRIETYRGLAILATNLRAALDPAFLRRLRFVVTFPYPGPSERQLIWRRAFPPQARLGALDFAQLGRLNLTGGNIATVALNAAFLAVAEDGVVEMRHVLAAARAEYVKLDRPLREADFLAAVDPIAHERVA